MLDSARGTDDELAGQRVLPRGPRSAVLSSLGYVLRPYSYYQRCLRRYGDPFLFPSLHGPLLVTASPDGAKAIFTASPETFEVFGRSAVAPLFGPSSIFLVAGDRHRRDRRLLTPPLHGPRLRAYGQLMVEAVERTMALVTGQPTFVALAVTQAISLEVILRAVFGVAEVEARDRLRQAVLAVDASATPSIVVFEALRRDFGGVGPWARLQRTVGKLDELIYAEIARRRASPVGDDILALLVSARHEDGTRMTDPEIRDELQSLLTAGHETTAIALAWALYRIHRDDEVLDRLRNEIAQLGSAPAPDQLVALPYLDAVCCETLRLHPIIPEVTRLLRRPLAVRGYQVPAGMGVAALISALHLDPAIYPDPTSFRPERFQERKYSPFEYAPFGGGARRCIGMAFALFEMKIVLGTLLGRWQLQLETRRDVRPVRRSVPVGPKGGVPFRLLGRR